MVRGLSAAQWNEAANAEQLAIDLAAVVEGNLREAIDAHGKASLVLSGGSTPLPFFKQLSKASLDWSVVDVTLADERWVPEDHEDSNARFVRENFLVGAASTATFHSLYRNTEPVSAIRDVKRSLEALAQPFSVVILGMGGDGHTASLFPDTDGLEAALDLDNHAMLAVLKPVSVPQTRISLTRVALLNSRYRYLHITGQQKHDVLSSQLDPVEADTHKDGQSGAKPLPIAAFFGKHLPPISVYWCP